MSLTALLPTITENRKIIDSIDQYSFEHYGGIPGKLEKNPAALRNIILNSFGYRGTAFNKNKILGLNTNSKKGLNHLIQHGYLNLPNISKKIYSDNYFDKILKNLAIDRSKVQLTRQELIPCMEDFSSLLLKHVLSPELLKIISLYIGVDKPFIYPVRLRIIPPNSRNKGANLYHRDVDNTKWLKLFVSLSNCVGGEHLFMQGSHIAADVTRQDPIYLQSIVNEINESTSIGFSDQYKAKSQIVTFFRNGRFDSDQIRSLFGNENEVSFPMHFGNCWLEDTYGLHCGNPSSKGSRYLFNFLIGKIPLEFK